MSEHYDAAETAAPADREADLAVRLRDQLQSIPSGAAGAVGRLNSLADLASLPVVHKQDLMERQAAEPPFGGYVAPDALSGRRIFMSPGPIYEPQPALHDPANVARAFHAAGIRPSDLVHNAFSYHMTPGAFLMEAGALSLGCTVFPAGTGNTDMQVEAAAHLRPDAYCGTPDFLKVILDRAAETGRDLGSIRKALVSGGALFPSLRQEYLARGVAVAQCYATAECGVIAYEVLDRDGRPLEGMVINENLIVEIVRPGTGDPVADGEVGEVVVTTLDPVYPLVRLATGDLSAFMPGTSPCGRTNRRIKGWMGRADQRTKIKGMFVDPRQIAEVLGRHPGIERARLVVGRRDEKDVMTLRVARREGAEIDPGSVRDTLRDVTKLGGAVEFVSAGDLPNDGKVIADERDY